MRKYKYFVAYAYRGKSGYYRGFGNSEIVMDAKINSYEDIKKIEEIINKDKSQETIVLNFQLLN